ncbi:MAG TPA: DALR anticodon-binding domain-containing protein [Leptolyngbya sp.]|jgi:arginyl-tRNA synthetase|nr:DALR anticodon-binding domain-containing protein [Leptolyngbya sp.]
MNCNLPKITYPTLRTLLLVEICQAISQKKDVQVANGAIECASHTPNPSNLAAFRRKPLLKRVTNQTAIAAYRSAIAIQLAAESTQSHTEFVYQVVQFFQISVSNSLENEIEKALLRNLTVSSTETGQLEFEFEDGAIALWLQTVLQGCHFSQHFLPDAKLSENSQIFYCQYHFARCSALLRLVDLPKVTGQTVEVAWLRDGKLLLKQERSLVAQIITTLDHWEERSALQLAIALAQAFEIFYRKCQIVKYNTVDPELAQCRLGLVMITHWLLKQLLEQGMGVLAPETL